MVRDLQKILRMKLQRLLQMSPTEIKVRTWQQASKIMERIGSEPDPEQLLPDVLAEIDHPLVRGPYRSGDTDQAQINLLSQLRWQAGERFFPGADDGDVAALIGERFPERRREIIARADKVRENVFPILGYAPMHFGEPVDWHFDPLANVRSPRDHWSQLNTLDYNEVGDHKVIWELNRHQWLLELAQAYQFTNDESYVQKAVELLQSWMEENPPGYGINWSSSLEVAMRAMAWSWALMLMRGSATLTPQLYTQMLCWISVHGKYIERYLSWYFSPNTHLTGEALGLYYIGSLFSELEQAGKWRETSHRILVDEIDKQVYADGVYFEQATRYQYYTIDIYTQFMLLAERNGDAIPSSLRDKVERMVEVLLTMRHPNGDMPLIGDADGGWLTPFLRREPRDFQPLFSNSALVFGRADFAGAAGGLALESLWWLGSEAANNFENLHAETPGIGRLEVFPDGGYAVLRSSDQADAQQAIFDVGPLGCPHSGGHGHADLLSIQIAAFGEPLIVDPGTYHYHTDSKWREHFRSTLAHNTISIDGESQARTGGPFRWLGERPAARLNGHSEEQHHLLVDAEHDAYLRLGKLFTHRRRLVFVEAGFWLLVDDLTRVQEVADQDEDEEATDEPRSFCSNFQLAIGASSEELDDNWLRVSGRGGAGLLMRSFADAELQRSVQCGEENPEAGWVAPDYGQLHAAPTLRYRGRLAAGKSTRLLTLIVPGKDAEQTRPRVSTVGDQGLNGLRLEIGGEQWRIDIDDEAIKVAVANPDS